MNRISRFVHTMRYVAYAVDLCGVVHATYELECGADEDAKSRAAKFLDAHPVIEVWRGARRLERLTAAARREKRSMRTRSRRTGHRSVSRPNDSEPAS